MNKYVITSNASIISVVLFKPQGNTSSMYETSRILKLKPYLWTIFINQISKGICVLTCQMEEAKAKAFTYFTNAKRKIFETEMMIIMHFG